MKLLSQYKSNVFRFIKADRLDAHVHLFDKDGVTPYLPGNGWVGFADYSILHLDEYKEGVMLNVYKQYDYSAWKNYNLLACSPYPEECIEIYNTVSGMAGFGELKAYNKYIGDSVKNVPDMKNMDYWKSVFEFANKHKLPIWIHWSLVNKDDLCKFKEIIWKYNQAKFILCHCGVGRLEEYSDSEDMSKTWSMLMAFELCKKFANCYTDISYIGAEWLKINDQLMSSVPLEKIVLGSDLNRNCFYSETNPDTKDILIKDYNYFLPYFNNYTRTNLLKIFSRDND